jgi:ribose transport system ATP-binding protein
MAADVHAPDAESPAALVARGIRKSFNDVEVLHQVDFTLRRGEIHGLVGQNGAGKSTLVKIIDGAYAADEGRVEVLEARGVEDKRPRRTWHGVAMVFQEFSLIPTMSVAANIMLNREPRGRLGLIDDAGVRRQAAEALAHLGAEIDVDRLVEDLPVGERQLVEIAKAISREASVLILDEPTASLAAAEIDALMAAIRRIVANGISIIYISHHLEEVLGICDRITVLRDGNVTLVASAAEATLPVIIEHMLGRSLERALAYQPRPIDRESAPLLRAVGLRNRSLAGVSFELHRGEILGIAGLLGSGRTELMRAVFGVDRLDAGSVELAGRPVRLRSPRDALEAGVALIPEDRASAGLVRSHRVGDNIMMAAWSRFAHAGFIDDRAARVTASALVDRLRIVTPSLDQEVRRLSGGNQQKVVVAKNLSVQPSVLLLDDPTVGVDIGSKLEILAQVRELAEQGNGILLVSSEFEELAGLADRVIVMRDGAFVRTLDREAGDDLSEEGLSRAVQQ